MTILERVSERVAVEGHDGRSGARLERGRLDDGTAVYVKTSVAGHDVGALVSGSATRERDLLVGGAFAQLPNGVTTALVGVKLIDDELVTVSRDVGAAILTWDDLLDAPTVERVFGGAAAVHEAFAVDRPQVLCPLEKRLAIFGPAHLDNIEHASPDLATAVRRGRELLADLVPAEIAEVVDQLFADPAPLAGTMRRAGTTLLHGDFWLVNLALDRDTLILLDWGLATDGPPALDFVCFCAGAMSNVTMDRDDLLALARQSCGRFTDDTVFDLAELWALMELGWNKALDVIDHPDPLKRARERADLEFWVSRAQRTLDRGTLT